MKQRRAVSRKPRFESCEKRLNMTVSFDAATLLSLPSETQQVGSVQAADFNGDSIIDLAVSRGGDGPSRDDLAYLEWFPGTSSETFEQVVNVGVGNNLGSELALGDIDLDGDLDLLASIDGLAWYENVGGTGVFEMAQQIRDSHTWELSLVDLDSDSDLDILTFVRTGRYDSTPAWYENLERFELGLYGAELLISTFGSSAHPADIDGDGRQDIVTNFQRLWAAGCDSSMTWSPGKDDAGEPFGEGRPFALEADICSYPSEPILSDFDGDGDVDIVTTYHSTLNFYENLGGGAFGEARELIDMFATNVVEMALIDFDNDGDLDIVLEARTEGRGHLLWLENDGNTRIVATHDIARSDFRLELHDLVDFDSDGDTDVIASIANDVVLYRSDAADQPQEILGDLDGDGVVDLADYRVLAANFHHQNVTSAEGDLNEDGVVDFADFLVLSRRYSRAVVM